MNRFTRIKFRLAERERVLGVGICLKNGKDDVAFCFLLRNGKYSRQPTSNAVIFYRGPYNLDGDQVNLALRKSTSQSSATGLNTIMEPGDSKFAVDGNTIQIFNNEAWQYNSVTRTEAEIRPWWEVDLAGDKQIRRIVIYKREDIYEDNLKDFTIYIFNADGITTAIKNYNGTAPPISSFDFDGVNGRRVKIELNGSIPRVLCLTEVEVYGSEFEFDIPIGQLFSLPHTEFREIAFIQDRSESMTDNANLDIESSSISNISFKKGHVNKLVSVDYESFVNFRLHADNLSHEISCFCFEPMQGAQVGYSNH